MMPYRRHPYSRTADKNRFIGIRTPSQGGQGYRSGTVQEFLASRSCTKAGHLLPRMKQSYSVVSLVYSLLS
jgi:hypothetical protein